MRYVLLLFLMVGCGSKHKVMGDVKVSGLDKPIQVVHVFKVDESMFYDSCAQKYEDPDDVEACVAANKAAVEAFINSLNRPSDA